MNRIARAKLAQAFRPSKRAEARYVRDLRSILAEVHRVTMRGLDPVTRHDAQTPTLGTPLVGYVRVQTSKAFNRMAADVKKKHAVKPAALQVIGIHPDALLEPIIAGFRDANLSLMVDAAEDYIAQVRGVLDLGARVEDIAAELQKRAGVSESRAELIARDQTLKLNGQLNKTRQTSAGITEYTWSTSRDERVRHPRPGKLGPNHVVLDATRQTWGDPPVTNQATGETNEPGQDYQCRCIAIPYVPELDGI